MADNYLDSIGLNSRMRRGFAAEHDEKRYVSALEDDVQREKSRLVNNIVSKGTVQTVLGGFTEFKSKTGGTTLFTVDPVTGETVFGGPVVANVSLNIGTANDTVIAGTSSLTGTLTSTGIISGGTINNATLGTVNVVGGTLTSVALASGTIPNARLSGLPILDTTAGSSALAANGGFAIQTFSGSAVLVARLAGVTYYFTSAGTLA